MAFKAHQVRNNSEQQMCVEASRPSAYIKNIFIRTHEFVKASEPWGVMLSLLALLIALGAFVIDYGDRIDERYVRAWQLITTQAPGNSGKRPALEYLNSERYLLCLGTYCALKIKSRESLAGINLSSPIPNTPRELGDVLLPEGPYLKGAELPQADLLRAAIPLADLSGANLSGADLSFAMLMGSNLTDAKLSNAKVIGTNFDAVRFDRADLSSIDFTTVKRITNAVFKDAILKDANLSGCNLTGADFGSGDLSNTDLSNTILASADLSKAHLAGVNLHGACGNGTTELPEGYTALPECKEDPEHFDPLRFDCDRP